MLRDVRYALRTLRKAPGFSAVAILTLALGIGLATAVFTVAVALLLRRLPVRDQDRLVVLWGQRPDRDFDYPLGLDDGREFARSTRMLERAALFLFNGAGALPIRDRGQVSQLRRALVSGDFFNVLGARAALGRTLRPADDVRGAAPVLVLSHAAWRERFGADPHVLGRQVVLYGGGTAYTIVGVMPQGLDYPKGTDFWAPVVPSMSPEGLSLMGFYVLGRLTPGATPANAREEMTTLFRRPDTSPWQRDLTGAVRVRRGRRVAASDHMHQCCQSPARARPRPHARDRAALGARRRARAGHRATANRERTPRDHRRRAWDRRGGWRRPSFRRLRTGRATPPGRDSPECHRAGRRHRNHRRRDASLRPRARGPSVACAARAVAANGHAAEPRQALPAREGSIGSGTGRARAGRSLGGGTDRQEPH